MALIHDFTSEKPGNRSIHVPAPVSAAVNAPSNFLVIGTKLAGAPGAPLVPSEIFDSQGGHNLFGQGSDIGEAAEIVKLGNPGARVFCLASAEAGGTTAATALLSAAGTATAAGTAPIIINDHLINVGVTVGMTAVQFIAALVAATASLPKLNVTLAVGSPTTDCDVTCKWGGTSGNNIGIIADPLLMPAGLTLTVPAFLTGGAGDPDIATALAVVDLFHYKYIVTCTMTDADYDVLEPFAEARWQGRDARRCHLFGAANGSLGALLTIAGNRNHQTSTIVGAGLSPSASWKHASAFALERSIQTNVHTDVTLESLGQWVSPPPKGSEFTSVELDQLIKAGMSTEFVGADGNLYIDTVLTTYTTDALGGSVKIYKFLTSMMKLAQFHETIEARLNIFRNKSVIADGVKERLESHEVTLGSITAHVRSLIVGPLSATFFDPNQAAATVVTTLIPGNPGFVKVDVGSSEVSKPFQGAFVTVSHS